MAQFQIFIILLIFNFACGLQILQENELESANINNSNLKFGDRLSPRARNASSAIMDESKQKVDKKSDKIDLSYLNNTITTEISVSHVTKSVNRVINDLKNITAEAHRLEMSTEFFYIPKTTVVTTIKPGGVIVVQKPKIQPVNRVDPNTTSTLRNEPWVVPVLVLSSLSMLMMAGFEVFVLCKAWRTTPSRRHLFLGQMLLLGLFACSGLSAVLAATPTLLTCASVRFGAGVSFALVFAALLVKCVFLISLNGGVYLPAPYQGLLLLFAVLIQVAVGAQWLVTSPPEVDVIPLAGQVAASHKHPLLVTADDLVHEDVPTVYTLCRTPFSDMLMSFLYVVFLIIFVAILAIKSRGIRDNYREATYIGLSVGCTIPIWLIWVLCGLVVADRHKDACLAFGLMATSCTVFLVMFMPKGRQLAAMGKEGVYVEDREDRFSSLSRAGSGYSPSFFHFKPIKYGVMGNGISRGGSTTKHATATTAVATLGGDRVALVSHPPSYTRMYHPNATAHHSYSQHFYPDYHPPMHHQSPPTFCYYPRYPGLFMRSDDANVYTTLEQTLSSNPNVYFQRGGGVHPGMMY